LVFLTCTATNAVRRKCSDLTALAYGASVVFNWFLQ